jgi:predicted enzyme related to lactoylglutathione lyase
MAKKPVVGWWEITLADKSSSDAVKRFFGEVFGWKIKSDPQSDYGEVSREDAGIGGGIGPTNQPGAKNQVTFYIDVDDIDSYLEKINKAGGKTVMPATPVSPDTTFAQFTDPAGNLIGLFKHSGP